MYRILVAECEQEISSFNPVLSQYSDFEIHQGAHLIAANEGMETCIRGALNVFRAHGGVEVIPTYGAKACSAGPLSRPGFERIASELLAQIQAKAADCDALYFSLHGAMGAEHELDPEGYLVEEARKILGPDKPIVLSLDLHGVLTDRMLKHSNGVAIYHTYPHEDFVDTGERAARLLLKILEKGVQPVVAKVMVPALVRGPELITKTGLYGDIIRYAQGLEQNDEKVLGAGMMIGNPFTDVPELCSMAIVVTDGDEALARENALKMANDFWADREKMQAQLDGLEAAIADAGTQKRVTFTDAADAPSSGASGDGNAILKGLLDARFPRSVLMPIVDAPAVDAAKKAGPGATITVTLGGTLDPQRFPPIELEVVVDLVSAGHYRHEVTGQPADAGHTAVLLHDNYTIIAVSKPVFMMDRAIFKAHGRDPEQFDLVVVKSPGAYARYFTYADKNYVVDVPGSTTANLPLLGHTVCQRPMYPLDPNVTFTPEVRIFGKA